MEERVQAVLSKMFARGEIQAHTYHDPHSAEDSQGGCEQWYRTAELGEVRVNLEPTGHSIWRPIQTMEAYWLRLFADQTAGRPISYNPPPLQDLYRSLYTSRLVEGPGWWEVRPHEAFTARIRVTERGIEALRGYLEQEWRKNGHGDS